MDDYYPTYIKKMSPKHPPHQGRSALNSSSIKPLFPESQVSLYSKLIYSILFRFTLPHSANGSKVPMPPYE